MKVFRPIKIGELVNCDTDAMVDELLHYVEVELNLPVEALQLSAWGECIDFLKRQFENSQYFYDYFLIFEYPLTDGSLRRPDIIILTKEYVYVLEFKKKDIRRHEHIEQVTNYVRNIEHFHYVTQQKKMLVNPYLVFIQSSECEEELGISFLDKDNFLEKLNLQGSTPMNENEVAEWCSSKYNCLPSIVESAVALFENGDLPYIKNIAEGEITRTISFIKKQIRDNMTQERSKKMFILSGVPGSGKTLVGLKLIHDFAKASLELYGQPLACYTSGNGPLIRVLQKEIQNGSGSRTDVLIQPLSNLKRKFGSNKYKNNIETDLKFLFFDEAQRAWISNEKKYGIDKSDAEIILDIGEEMYNQFGFANIVCSIGEGQEIFDPEGGFALWKKEIEKYLGWKIYTSPSFYEELSGSRNEIIDCTNLMLDVSIRNNFIDISKWVEAVLEADLAKAKWELHDLKQQGFIVRICNTLHLARSNAEYQAKLLNSDLIYNSENKTENNCKSSNPKLSTFGYIVSSKVSATDQKYKKNNRFDLLPQVSIKESGNWFTGDCRKWEKAANEFVCQGLEIDVANVVFTGDYIYRKEENRWEIPSDTYKKVEEEITSLSPETVIQNTYRVLLSRSRRALILTVPNDKDFKETFDFFRDMGVEVLTHASDIELK